MRISWAGRVWRSEGLSIFEQIKARETNKKRSRGRTGQRRADRLKEDPKILGVRNAEETVKNGEYWRRYVIAAMRPKGGL